MGKAITTTRAQESTNAIERMYITMRHLFNRGFYKPNGVSGEALKNALLQLRPEIYGSVGEEKAELNGLIYVLERLPEGIEQCSFINLTSDEGYGISHINPIIPPKRRRNCYRIDEEQMNIEITRGRSDIYDILTHLTFLFIESEKICKKVLITDTDKTIRDWTKLENAVQKDELPQSEREIAIIHTANILGRSFEEILEVYKKFSTKDNPDRFLKVIYWLGKLALDEEITGEKRTITFSALLRERLGHHIHGERWANNIKEVLTKNNLLQRPIHIISANMHSVMNSLFAKVALKSEFPNTDSLEIFEALSSSGNAALRKKVIDLAEENGMIAIDDTSGTNIDVQIFDTAKIKINNCSYEFSENQDDKKPVIFVMDYAFGEQAYETIDELLKPYVTKKGGSSLINVDSVSIMGKAGILEGGKGDLMIPSAHIFEGTADNYPFNNELCAKDFEGYGLKVFEGTMVTVLGTSLQNKDILKFFHKSTWNVIGLEMEGVHYQKAIQSASKIRKSIGEDVKVRYAYYASDNPLETGSTLASGGLGTTGVKPTYLITDKILKQIFNT
ncbi:MULTISPECIES: DUF6909 family protein [unclassified Maribacter]|uniref:DUF6909 family protein n=1 Tax=unclassified Maribacter TaxID=2615042 RepID=UPI0008F49359|nr:MULTISPECIES: hypothetical protein [unclassified Maribacter]APA64318.1 hypothetical protein YQ22_08305 [Maribacter sp. 1_2014MBL_MicDiv]|tara:strand:- start:131928 stop:133610 length:1683 start_codon:yes stop_codon:yes gene_type:complete